LYRITPIPNYWSSIKVLYI